jgi:hypothetical protein
LENLVTALEKEGIKAVVRQNKDGIIYGLTYVDHKTKCVFNGSDLGKQYSAKGIQERCSLTEDFKQNQTKFHHTIKHQEQRNHGKHDTPNSFKDILAAPNLDKVIDDLIQPTQTSSYVPHQLKKNKKKKRKNISNNL